MYVLQTEIKLQFLVAARVKLRKTGRDERRTLTIIQEHRGERRRSGRSATSAMFFAALNNKWTALHVTTRRRRRTEQRRQQLQQLLVRAAQKWHQRSSVSRLYRTLLDPGAGWGRRTWKRRSRPTSRLAPRTIPPQP